MFSSEEQSDEATGPLFHPFTRESLAAIEARLAEPAAQKPERAHLKAEGAIGLDVMPEKYPIMHHDKRLKPDPTLKVGMPLPRNLSPNFPPELIATPIEDLDKYYENERTFMIINKGKYILRFSATNSMFILSPFNPLRRLAISTLVHPVFCFLVMATIFVNCVLMTMPSNESIESSEIIFTLIYSVELCIKVIAMGFILEKFTYLRDPWNWLDLILIALAYVTMGVDLGNLSSLRALRTFRVLTAFKNAAGLPGLKTALGYVIESVKNLKYVIILTLYSLSVFALLGLQVYMGVLTQKCVRNPDPSLNMSWDEYISNYSKTEENWLLEDGEYILCGNSSGARHCPDDSTCVQGVGPNPNYGYTTFDSFPWALLSAFRMMALDFWESLLLMVLKSAGTWNIYFFVVIILWCSLYLAYLILAVVAMTYNELTKKIYEEENGIAFEEAAADAAAAKAEAAANSLDPPDSDNCLSKKQSDSPYPDLNRQTAINMKERDEKEKPLKEHQKNRCLTCTDTFCVWDCCVCWVRFQEIVSLIIFDPFMELFITLCVVVNILFMAMDHHDMEEGFYIMLKNGNYFFTGVYVIEAVFKLIALSPKYYFSNGWNRFDFIIAALSLLEVVLEGVHGLSVLGFFRLLRFFKLAKSWPTLNRILSIMCTSGPRVLGNLTFVFGILIFFFSLMGMQLFGRNYDEKKHLFKYGEVPNWNFRDFFHSFMIVFRALCGEWIETMWDCLLVGGWTCIPFFLSIVVIVNLVVLNIFLALMLSTFSASNLAKDPADSKNLQEVIKRFSRANQWLKNILLQFLKCIRAKRTNASQIPDQRTEMMRKEMPEALIAGDFVADGQVPMMEIFSKNHTDQEVVINDLGNAAIQEAVKDGSQISRGSDKHSDYVEDIMLHEYPADCCPECCYVRFPFCQGGESEFRVRWYTARKKSFYAVEHNYFEAVVIAMIFISSFALAAEDVRLKDRPLLKDILQYMDIVFTVFFLFEMLLQWMAYGLKKYFTNAWCWLDFVILLVSIINLVVELDGNASIPAFKAMRTLRAFRRLSMSRWEGIRVVFNALVQAIPAIFNVFLVCLFFWSIFAVLGVQMMGGKFYACTDLDDYRLNASFVPNKGICFEKNFTWTNQMINFDNVLNAYLALFQVATFKGWVNIMNSAIDSTGLDQQPEEEYSIYMYLYFVYFAIFGSFFTLSLIIGVTISNFNEQKRKARGCLEMFMTEGQKLYYHAMEKMVSKKPVKAIPRPQIKLQAMVFDLTTNKKFDMVIMIFICLNMSVIAMEHYDPSPLYDSVLEGLNMFCVAVFTAECMLKIFALRKYYFRKPWNIFDFVIVILSILGIVLKDLITKYYFVSPTLLRVVCVVKVGRVLRLVKFLLLSKGIRTLFYVLAMSLPELFHICLLHCLVMFIYAIFGMFFFMNVRHRAGIDQNFNFETFGQTMILLFSMYNSAGWDAVLAAIMEENDCNEGEDGDCGSRNTAVAYLVSYVIISFLILIMYIAVILEKYNQAMEDLQKGLTEDDYDRYYEIWQKFDPDGTQFISYSALSTFLDSLEEPLKITKPNKYKIISMNIPICEGDLVFCVHILDALTKDFFQRKGYHIDESAELAVVPKEVEGYNPITSTSNRQREIYAAHVIQLAWDRYRGKLGDTEPQKGQQQQTAIVVESDGHNKVVIHSQLPSLTSKSADV